MLRGGLLGRGLLGKGLLALSLTLALGGAAQAAFPEAGRPVTVILPYPPGGGSDLSARALAPQALSRKAWDSSSRRSTIAAARARCSLS